ncbi:MAG TPA: iron-sulfur cluster repair di-iron protein [Bryobacteraceae bacterium]|nr:iron-sulfur cluster repair di-iron protein [Bryobacteraceae bacterium]
MTVGEIAARMPASARVLEQFGIDFCCGGQAPFSQACQARSLDPAAVLAEIERSAGSSITPAPDWQSASLSGLIDHIVNKHHAYLKTELPRLENMLEKIIAKHSERHGDVLMALADTFRPMHEELDAHLMKEEHILFPLIRSLESAPGRDARFSHCGSVQNPIRVMVMEHDSAGEALARLRNITAGYTPPADACNTFRAFYYELDELEHDLHQHIHLENNILFPRAVELEASR